MESNIRMKKVEDLFYFIMRGLADKTLTMETPISVVYVQGDVSGWDIDILVDEVGLRIILCD